MWLMFQIVKTEQIGAHVKYSQLALSFLLPILNIVVKVKGSFMCVSLIDFHARKLSITSTQVIYMKY